MFIVMINLWNGTGDDYYDFEYSGTEWNTREEAEIELEEAKIEAKDDYTVESVYIREV